MEKLVMPEIITPAFAEVLSANPEIIKELLGVEEGGTSEKAKNPKSESVGEADILKFVLCNVNINMWNTENIAERKRRIQEIRELVDRISANLKKLDEKAELIDGLSKEVAQLRDETLVLDARIKEGKKVLKLVIGMVFNRRFSYAYKQELNGLYSNLFEKKAELEEKTVLLLHEKYAADKLEKENNQLTTELLQMLL